MLEKLINNFLFYSNEIVKRIKSHHIESFSSQIAFFMLLSIFPYLIILFMILSQMSVSYAQEMTSIYNMIPDDAAKIIKDYLEYSAEITGGGGLSSLVVVSIWMSSNAMTALMKAFNVAYNIEETRNYFKRKVIGIVCTMLTILLIITALIIPNVAMILMSYIRKYLTIPEMNMQLFINIKNIMSLLVFIFVLGGLYVILPNKKIRAKEVIPGTIFSFFSLVFISYLFSYFVNEYSKYSLVYGGLAAVIILLIWLFICGLIIMFGAELNSIISEKNVRQRRKNN